MSNQDWIVIASIALGTGLLGYVIGSVGKLALKTQLRHCQENLDDIYIEMYSTQDKLRKLTDRDARGRFVKKEG